MKNLTEEQILALPVEFNLADGHAYRPWNSAEKLLIQNVGNIFQAVDRRQQDIIEKSYIETFLKAAAQTYPSGSFTHFMCFTASMGIEVVANYMRVRKLSVALIEPCFDNLHDILIRHNVQLSVFPEHWMQASQSELAEHLLTIQSDVLMLVTPNNPTGVQLSEEALNTIIDFCRAHHRILVIDTTFRFFQQPDSNYDQYAILAESGIKCILIEDTGKTWPTLEIKAPFFSVSKDMVDHLAHIYSDFVLHVSPVAVVLLKGFIELGTDHVHAVVLNNRQTLLSAISGTCLKATAEGRMSVEWLAVNGDNTAKQLQELFASYGVAVLTGNQFFWADPTKGDQFLRVALVRDQDMFQRACDKIRQALSTT